MTMKRMALIAGVAAAFTGASQAAVTELTVFSQPDYRGAAHTIKGEVANLEGVFSPEVASMRVKGGYWELCTRDHFKGDCHVVAAGDYSRLDRALNRRVTSVRFLGADERQARSKWRAEHREARGEWRDLFAANERREDRREAREERREDRREDRRDWRDERRDGRAEGSVELYGARGFRGRAVQVERSERNLFSERFDGRASSLVVNEGTWQVCSEPGFEGVCRVYGPGRYAQLAELDDRVSSLRRVR